MFWLRGIDPLDVEIDGGDSVEEARGSGDTIDLSLSFPSSSSSSSSFSTYFSDFTSCLGLTYCIHIPTETHYAMFTEGEPVTKVRR